MEIGVDTSATSSRKPKISVKGLFDSDYSLKFWFAVVDLAGR